MPHPVQLGMYAAHEGEFIDEPLLRRLDWRFLLPEPEIDSVVYWGSTNNQLALALQRYAPDVVFNPAAPPAQACANLTVLSSRRRRDIRLAGAWLKPGGYLCWQPRKGPLALVNRPTLWRSWLCESGFGDARTYLLVPNFQRCGEIVPLDEACAVRKMVERKFPHWPDSLHRLAASGSARWLVARTAPAVILLAQKGT